MSLLSWFSSGNTRAKDVKEQQNDIPANLSPIVDMTFDDIATQLDFFRSEYIRATKLCQEANDRFSQYRQEIKELRQHVRDEIFANDNLQVALDIERKGHDNLKKQRQSDQLEIKLLKQSVKQHQKQLKDERSARSGLNDYISCLEEQITSQALETKSWLSIDKTAQTSLSTMQSDATLLPQPFVVVLVDGDAYSWSPDLFLHLPNPTLLDTNQPNRSSPGALAAARIKTEVTKYILSHPSQIPVSSKILTRVFINYSGSTRSHHTSHIRKRQLSMLSEFMLQFTQSMPLFDFFDAGIGKERVDDKIRETFHLFISNPHCHAVFLAACTDNGFARMLEPYQHLTTAKENIVLVSPGYVESEIKSLGFHEVSWPAVFAQKVKHVSSRKTAKLLRDERVAALAKTEDEAQNKRLGITGLQNDYVAALVLDMFPPWHRGGGGVGRRPQSMARSLSSLDFSTTVSVSEDGTLLDNQEVSSVTEWDDID